MNVLGIGNAIVDVICKIDENFLSDETLTVYGTTKSIIILGLN